MIVYYFDENMSEHLARSLDELGKGINKFRVKTVIEEFEDNAMTDPEIVDRLLTKKHNCVIVTCDSDFRKRKLYSLIMSSENLGLLHIKYPKGTKALAQYKFVVNCWESIIKIEKFPYAYVLQANRKLLKI